MNDTTNNIIEIYDISFAAYLKMNKVPMGEVKKNEIGKYIFQFHLTDEAMTQYKMDFFNSECYQFDLNAKTIRMLLKQKNVG